MNYIAKHLVFLGSLYFVFSFTEYFVHRHVMHGSKTGVNHLAKNHWTHHEHTLDDLNLKKSDEYNSNVNKYLGLYFIWIYTLAVFIVGLTEAYVLNLLLCTNIDIRYVVLYAGVFAGYQSSFWNTIHPDIHNIHENITWLEGVPGSDIWRLLYSNIAVSNDMTLYDWFKRNHRLHHLRKGERKGNYNVTLPGADWFMGTMYSVQT